MSKLNAKDKKTVKENAANMILDRIRSFDTDEEGIKPGKMMRGASQIVARLLREKVRDSLFYIGKSGDE